MRKLILNPTRDQLLSAFAEAAAAANNGARTRLVEVSEDWADIVFAAPHGAKQHHGGGVAHAYQQRAFSSVVAVSWYTRPCGTLAVRVVGDRGVCNGGVRSCLLGTRLQRERFDTLGVPAIYTEVKLFLLYSGRIAGAEGFSKRLRKNPQNITAWLVLADWCEENNHTEDAATIRAAFALPDAV